MPVTNITAIPKITTGNISGPASYSAGGFTLDLSASFSSLNFLKLIEETPGALPDVEYEVLMDRTASGAVAYGQVAIKLVRPRYDKFSIGNVTGLPSGVTAQTSKFAAATSTGSSHTHSTTHDHPATNSSTPTAAGLGVDSAAGRPDIAGHTHSVDVPSEVFTSGASTHAHDRSFEYNHGHGTTQAETDATLTEVANGTNLSAVTWRYLAVGQGDQ